jgi:hypothetical protein
MNVEVGIGLIIYDVFNIFILYVQIIYYLNIKYENMKYAVYVYTHTVNHAEYVHKLSLKRITKYFLGTI